MCMYLTNGNFLGQRLIGYDFYDSKTRGFVGMTEKQVITKLKNKEKVYAVGGSKRFICHTIFGRK